jgi:hypothetical protein
VNQNSPQYGINNFQRVIISIGEFGGGVDRTNGEYFPQYEGTGFYVEGADFPVLMTLNSTNGGVEQAIALRDGIQFLDLPFKGFTLIHPPMNMPLRLSIIVLKGGSSYTNQLNDPNSHLPIPFRVITNTAVSTAIGLYVPPGVRAAKNLVVYQPQTTISYSQVIFYDKNLNEITAPTTITQQINGAIVTYNGAYLRIPGSVTVLGATASITFPPVFIPLRCAEIQITTIGTGLGTPGVTGNYE